MAQNFTNYSLTNEPVKPYSGWKSLAAGLGGASLPILGGAFFGAPGALTGSVLNILGSSLLGGKWDRRTKDAMALGSTLGTVATPLANDVISLMTSPTIIPQMAFSDPSGKPIPFEKINELLKGSTGDSFLPGLRKAWSENRQYDFAGMTDAPFLNVLSGDPTFPMTELMAMPSFDGKGKMFSQKEINDFLEPRRVALESKWYDALQSEKTGPGLAGISSTIKRNLLGRKDLWPYIQQRGGLPTNPEIAKLGKEALVDMLTSKFNPTLYRTPESLSTVGQWFTGPLLKYLSGDNPFLVQQYVSNRAPGFTY